MAYSLKLAYDVVIEETTGEGHSVLFTSLSVARKYAANNVGVDVTVTINAVRANNDVVEAA